MGLITIEDADRSILNEINRIAEINGQYVKVDDASGQDLVNIMISNNQKCMIIFEDDCVTFRNRDNSYFSISISISDFSSITIL